MPIVIHVFLAGIMTVLQVAFFSHLPEPLASVSFPLIAIAMSIFTDHPVRGALWAFVGGIVLDLHGIFPFGTELIAMLAIFHFTRLLFRRFITNASLAAAFLLASVIAMMHAAVLLALDGLRVVFGSDPFIITPDTEFLSASLRVLVVNATLTVVALAAWRRTKERFAHRFIIRS